ncbi:172_t:CDS:2 [Paraglomus occultum]|uniref:172_t:CDS:1 n=1 Tax=Paraglomus occultum TaxID=144539 RepID=A0A9N8ZSB4_9GLOM|nr:172_t:CDS:2 [Paraglomus occultum]
MADIVDANEYLIEFLASVDNLPSEIRHHSYELKNKEDEIREILENIKIREKRLWAVMDGIKSDAYFSSSSSDNSGSERDSDYEPCSRRRRTAKRVKRTRLFADEDEDVLVHNIRADYQRASQLQDEKLAIASKMSQLVERHVKRMDEDFDALYPQHNLRDNIILSSSPNGITEAVATLHTVALQDESLDYTREWMSTQIVEGEQFSLPMLPNPRNVVSDRQLRGCGYLFQMSGRRNGVNGNRQRNTRASILPTPPPSATNVLTNMDSRRISFGEMIACDGEHCPYEWFHLVCLGFTEVPKGKWFCSVCASDSDAGTGQIKRKRGRPVGSGRLNGGDLLMRELTTVLGEGSIRYPVSVNDGLREKQNGNHTTSLETKLIVKPGANASNNTSSSSTGDAATVCV